MNQIIFHVLLEKMRTKTYLDSGVNILAGEDFIKKIRQQSAHVGVNGGLFPWGEDYLVATSDGVGTKLKLAFALENHETIGIDLVAMCVNDLLMRGAKPLFFLDYFATAKLDIAQGEKVLSGIHQGCREAGCLLLGGETAEMPGIYQPREYDLAGFAVGVVKKEKLIDGRSIAIGDVIIGLPSSGAHSNGFTLIRKILEEQHISLQTEWKKGEKPLGLELLTPTKIYVAEVLDAVSHYQIKAISHITGGGMVQKVPRQFPVGIGGVIQKSAWNVPSIFSYIQQLGGISEQEMFHTYNMGIGMTLIMDRLEGERYCKNNPTAKIIGKITAGQGITIR